MKKISVVLVVVLLLFSGCSSYREVELTDFEYVYNYSEKDTAQALRYLEIKPLVDIENLVISYTINQNIGGELKTDENTIEVGTINEGRTYIVLINSFSNDIMGYALWQDSFEIISATGKVKK
jgi:major membrane immunogen (membrane-anchored lipoprotein)